MLFISFLFPFLFFPRSFPPAEDISNLNGFFPIGTKLPVRRRGEETQPGEILSIKNLDDECAEIYRRHPFYKPPDLRQVLRQLIQSPT